MDVMAHGHSATLNSGDRHRKRIDTSSGSARRFQTWQSMLAAARFAFSRSKLHAGRQTMDIAHDDFGAG